MRTTINLDDDVLRVVKELAKLSGQTLGQVLSDLARTALAREGDEQHERNGVPLLARTDDARMVASDDVARLLDEP